MPNTIKLHRVIAAKPEKVFRAFTEDDAKIQWLPPYGFTATMHESDVRVGGHYKMSFRNFTTGNSHTFGGEFLEIIPNQKLRWTDQFDDPNMPGVMTVTVTLREVSVGTELHITQDGVPDMIPAEGCYLGWQESLMKLTKLVEPEINF